jgi:hypothetical protein
MSSEEGSEGWQDQEDTHTHTWAQCISEENDLFTFSHYSHWICGAGGEGGDEGETEDEKFAFVMKR